MASQPSLTELMQKAQQMQQKMQETQNELAKTEIKGVSGAGLVTIVMNGRHAVKQVIIDKAAVDEGIEILQDLIAAAINDAVSKVETLSRDKIYALSKGIQLPTDEDEL